MTNLIGLKKTILLDKGDYVIVAVKSTTTPISGVVKAIHSYYLVLEPTPESLTDKNLLQEILEYNDGRLLEHVIIADTDILRISKMTEVKLEEKKETAN